MTLRRNQITDMFFVDRATYLYISVCKSKDVICTAIFCSKYNLETVWHRRRMGRCWWMLCIPKHRITDLYTHTQYTAKLLFLLFFRLIESVLKSRLPRGKLTCFCEETNAYVQYRVWAKQCEKAVKSSSREFHSLIHNLVHLPRELNPISQMNVFIPLPLHFLNQFLPIVVVVLWKYSSHCRPIIIMTNDHMLSASLWIGL